MIKQVLFILLAGVAWGSPIAVNVSGSFGLDNFMDGNAMMCLSGSSATASVFFCADVPVGATPPTSFSGSSLHQPWMTGYDATVDGVSSNLWTFSVGGDGDNYLEVFDGTGNVLAKEDLVSSPIQTTSYQEFGTRFLANGALNGNWWARGTFSNAPTVSSYDAPLSQVPEAASGLFAGVGLLLLAAARFRRSVTK